MKMFTSLTCLAALVSVAPALAGPFPFAIETVRADNFFNNRPSLAVAQDGTVHVAHMRQDNTADGTKEIWHAERAPGGGWTFTQITNNAVREELPSLKLDADDHVHIAFHTGIPGGNHIRYVNDIAGEFGTIVDITPPSGTSYIIPEIEVDSSGVVHFVFTSQSTGPDDVFNTTWSEGAGVAPLFNLSNSADQEDGLPNIDIGPDGVIHVVWVRGQVSGQLVYAKKAPGGGWTGVATGVAGNAVDPIVRVSPQNVATILYKIGDLLFLVSDGGDGVFEPPQQLLTEATYRPAFWDNFAIGAGGERYVSVASNVGTEGVFFTGETSPGVFLSPPVRFPGDTLTFFGGSVGVNDAGTLAVAYHYGRFDQQQSRSISDLYLAIIEPAGCPADLDGNGQVGASDLAALLGSWSASAPGSPADLDGDGAVGASDLAALLGSWGACA